MDDRREGERFKCRASRGRPIVGGEGERDWGLRDDEERGRRLRAPVGAPGMAIIFPMEEIGRGIDTDIICMQFAVGGDFDIQLRKRKHSEVESDDAVA